MTVKKVKRPAELRSPKKFKGHHSPLGSTQFGRPVVGQVGGQFGFVALSGQAAEVPLQASATSQKPTA
jgi:hypothetical protein